MKKTNDSYCVVLQGKRIRERYYRDKAGWVKVSARDRLFRMTPEQVRCLRQQHVGDDSSIGLAGGDLHVGDDDHGRFGAQIVGGVAIAAVLAAQFGTVDHAQGPLPRFVARRLPRGS